MHTLIATYAYLHYNIRIRTYVHNCSTWTFDIKCAQQQTTTYISNYSYVMFTCSNKEIDILILNTKSALDVEKVIRYRKKHLDLQGK